MKKKNLFLTTVLGLALGLGVAGGLAANRAAKDVKEVRATEGTITYYLVGTMNSWTVTNTDYPVTDNCVDSVYTWAAETEFKLVTGGSWDNQLNYDNLASRGKGTWFEGNNGNIKVNQAGSYRVWTEGTTVHVDAANYYVCGEFNEWNNNDSTYPIPSDNLPHTFTFTQTGSFKFVHLDTWDVAMGYYVLNGAAKDTVFTDAQKDDNIYCNSISNSYAITIFNGVLYIDYADGADFHYYGNKTGSWDHDTSVKVKVNGNPTNIAFSLDEEFKLTDGYKWLGYSDLTNGDAFYYSFTNTGNLKCAYAATYRISLVQSNHNVTITIRGIDQTVYVLDKYGELLNSGAYAYCWNDNGNNGTWPGQPMTAVDGYDNLYSYTYWSELKLIITNNDGGQTVDLYPDKVNDNGCLILDGTMSSAEPTKWAAKNDDPSCDWVVSDAGKFVSKYMHFQDFDEQDQTAGAACKGSTGYYALAKAAYATLSADAKEDVTGLSYVADRLSAWAAANGESFTITNNVGSFSKIVNPFSALVVENNSSMIIIIIVSSALALTVGGYFLLRKKKQK